MIIRTHAKNETRSQIFTLGEGVIYLHSHPTRSDEHSIIIFCSRSHSRERTASLSAVDSANRKELEKTQRLLLEAKATCSVEIVSSKIQTAIEEIERVLALPPPPLSVNTATPPAPSSALPSPSKQLSGGIISRNSLTPSTALVTASSKQRGCESSANEDQFRIAGDLWKRGSRLRQMIKRYYVLHGNFLYYYAYVELIMMLHFVELIVHIVSLTETRRTLRREA